MQKRHVVLLGCAALVMSCAADADQIKANEKAIDDLSDSVEGAAEMLTRLEALETLAADLDSRQSALQSQTITLTSRVRQLHEESLFVLDPDGVRIGRVLDFTPGGVLFGMADVGPLVGTTLAGGAAIPGTTMDSIRFADADCGGAAFLPGGQDGQTYPGALVQSTGQIYVPTGDFLAAQATESRLSILPTATCENINATINGFAAEVFDTLGPMTNGVGLGPVAWE